MHQQPVLKKMKLFNNEKFPITEELSKFGLYLPSGLKLNKKKIDFICNALKKFFMNQENRSIFNEDYSKSYDLIYEKKNYNDECNRIIKFINYKKSVSNILDLGCGTCSHSIILSKYGFNIDAIDRSGKNA